MNETLLVGVILALLLGFEWHFKLRSLRVVTIMFTMVVLLFARPPYTTAARRVSVAPPQERVTQLHGSQLSEYQSGVATMYRAMAEAGKERAAIRLMVLGVLFWLSFSPVLRRDPVLYKQPPG